MNEARIDKWMWAVRIFKTRTIAAEACKKGRISINGALAKAARMVKPGDVIQVRKPPVTYSFKVLQTIEKRVGAKLVAEMMENVTTPDTVRTAGNEQCQRLSSTAPRVPDDPRKRIAAIWKILQNRNFWMTFDFEFDFEKSKIRKDYERENN